MQKEYYRIRTTTQADGSVYHYPERAVKNLVGFKIWEEGRVGYTDEDRAYETIKEWKARIDWKTTVKTEIKEQ